MAGIGFELKKLFQKKGIVSLVKANVYAGVITTGPMLLGISLMLGLIFLGEYTGLEGQNQLQLVCMITYTMIASLLFFGFFGMAVTRYLADLLYEERNEEILSSFFGAGVLTVAIGGLAYGIFLICSGISMVQILLNLILFCEFMLVWLQMNYLTALKDYRSILKVFVCSSMAAVCSAALGIWILGSKIEVFLLSVILAYGIMVVWYLVLLNEYFDYDPKQQSFAFLEWFDQYRELVWIGGLHNVGMFGHLLIIWFSPVGTCVKGLFYSAPSYDVPAFLAFLSVIVTTISFVVSVEVNFYPAYRNYYGLFNEKGSIMDIEEAEQEMLDVLDRELGHMARKQLYTAVLLMSVGLFLIELLPLGFNDLMEGYFRILCVAYGMYAVANVNMLVLLYFTDYRGAMWTTVVFAASSIGFTAGLLPLKPIYYGAGFFIAAFLFYLFTWLRLKWFVQNLRYHILSMQPIVFQKKEGVFTKASNMLQAKVWKYERKEKNETN